MFETDTAPAKPVYLDAVPVHLDAMPVHRYAMPVHRLWAAGLR